MRISRFVGVRTPARKGIPRGAVPASEAAVLFAVIHQERPTVRSVAETTHLTPSCVHDQLIQLRAKGLVTWTVGAAATLRPAVSVVRCAG